MFRTLWNYSTLTATNRLHTHGKNMCDISEISTAIICITGTRCPQDPSLPQHNFHPTARVLREQDPDSCPLTFVVGGADGGVTAWVEVNRWWITALASLMVLAIFSPTFVTQGGPPLVALCFGPHRVLNCTTSGQWLQPILSVSCVVVDLEHKASRNTSPAGVPVCSSPHVCQQPSRIGLGCRGARGVVGTSTKIASCSVSVCA